MTRSHRVLQSATTGLTAAVCVSAAVLLLWLRRHPLTGYEESFLHGIPLVLVVAPFLLLTVLTSVGFRVAPAKVALGVVLVTLCLAAMWNAKYGRVYGVGDVYVHNQLATEILLGGSPADANPYPALHLLFAVTSLILGVEVELLILNSFPYFVGAFLVLAVAASLRYARFPGSRVVASLLVLSSPLVSSIPGEALFPYKLGFLLVATALLALSLKGPAAVLASAILGTSLVIVHLQVALFFMAALAMIGAWRMTRASHASPRWTISIAAVTFLSFFLWVVQVNHQTQRVFAGIVHTIIAVLSETESAESSLGFVDRAPYGLLAFRFTLLVALLLMAVIASRVLMRRNNVLSSILAASFILTGAGLFIFTTLTFVKAAGTTLRYLQLVALAAPVLFPAAMIQLRPSQRHVAAVVLSLVAVVGVSAAFPTPALGYYSSYTTDGSEAGIAWTYDNIGCEGVAIMANGDSLGALTDSLLPEECRNLFHGSTNGLIEFMGLDPAHFRHRGTYEEYAPHGESEYLLVDEVAEHFVANPTMGGFVLKADAEDLRQDSRLNSIYSNRMFTAFTAHR